jgi:hypothetical protein
VFFSRSRGYFVVRDPHHKWNVYGSEITITYSIFRTFKQRGGSTSGKLVLPNKNQRGGTTHGKFYRKAGRDCKY